MDPRTQQNDLSVTKNLMPLLQLEFGEDPFAQATLSLVAKHLKITDNSVTNESILDCMRMFSSEAKQRKNQTEILEFFLGQLREKYQITASPCVRIFTSQPERSFLGVSNVRHYRLLEETKEYLRIHSRLELPPKINIEASSKFLMHLVFAEKINHAASLQEIFQAKADVETLNDLHWFSLAEGQFFVSEQILNFYKMYKAQATRYKLPRLCIWLGRHIYNHKLTMTEFLKASYLSLLCEYGTYSSHVAQGKIKSTCLSEQRFRHLIGAGSPISTTDRLIEKESNITVRQQRLWHQRPAATSKLSTKYQFDAIKNKLKPLSAHRTKRDVRKGMIELRGWLDDECNAAEQPWVWLLTGWGYWLYDKGGRKKGYLKSSSIARYLQFCRPLLSSLGTQEFHVEQTEQWIDIIENAVEAVGSSFQPAAVRLFVNFLIKNGIAPDLSIHDLEIPTLTKNVDANFFSPAEIQTVLASLRTEQGELAEIARLACCFGFASGMRRNEISGLKVGNVRFCKLPYIRLRHTHERTLKSTRSNRNIPLDIFWPEEELNLLKMRCSRAPKNLQNKLFADQTLLTKAMELVTKLLTAITGGQQVRFHHLRHTFANWCFWLLAYPRMVRKRIPIFMQHQWLSGKSAIFLRFRLGLEGSQLGRRELHSLAYLMGHSSPEITLSSYIHINNLVQALSEIPNDKRNIERKYSKEDLDLNQLHLLKTIIGDFVGKHKATAGATAKLTDIGNALFYLSGSRFAKKSEAPNQKIVAQLNNLISAQTSSLKIGHLFNRVMRKKVPNRVIPKFFEWLNKLETQNWSKVFGRQQLEQLVELTDPGKDFLFICRSLNECRLLEEWLRQFSLEEETEWRLRLSTRCPRYKGLSVQQQIFEEIRLDWQDGFIKNLSGPRGAAKGKGRVSTKLEHDKIGEIKCFSCEVIVRWDQFNAIERRRNQLLVGVLKAQLLWWQLQEIVN